MFLLSQNVPTLNGVAKCQTSRHRVWHWSVAKFQTAPIPTLPTDLDRRLEPSPIRLDSLSSEGGFDTRLDCRV